MGRAKGKAQLKHLRLGLERGAFLHSNTEYLNQRMEALKKASAERKKSQ